MQNDLLPNSQLLSGALNKSSLATAAADQRCCQTDAAAAGSVSADAVATPSPLVRSASSVDSSNLNPSPEIERYIQKLEEELDLVRSKGKLLSQELDLFRQRRLVFWCDRFRNLFDAWNLMNPAFQQLKDDSAMFCGPIQGYRLQPSLSMLRVSFLTYKIKLSRPNLRAILLAPVVDVPLTVGEICLRLFSEKETFLATATVPVSAIKDNKPIEFSFPPIANSDQMILIMRVFVQGVDAPVRIFELRRYALGGFGKLSTKPFAGYIFDRS